MAKVPDVESRPAAAGTSGCARGVGRFRARGQKNGRLFETWVIILTYCGLGPVRPLHRVEQTEGYLERSCSCPGDPGLGRESLSKKLRLRHLGLFWERELLTQFNIVSVLSGLSALALWSVLPVRQHTEYVVKEFWLSCSTLPRFIRPRVAFLNSRGPCGFRLSHANPARG